MSPDETPVEVVGATPTAEVVAEEITKTFKSMRQRVADDPSAYNRSTRRANGLRGRLFKMSGSYVPRFIRRHFTTDKPVTRRQRKAQARVSAIARQRGLVPA